MSDKNENHLVSVVMITYMHESYIKEAIEGVLMQICNYEIEVIIADDRSPDNTEILVKNIIQNHPNGYWIKYTRHTENKGMMPNFIWALQKAAGKYIALCEGDDYWIDPRKLQKQVDFLEANPGFNLSVGKVLIHDGQKTNRKVNEAVDSNKRQVYDLGDYLNYRFSQTSSFLFRNDFIFAKELYNRFCGDQALVVVLTRNKKIIYHNEYFSVYRIHDQGISNLSKSKEFYINIIDFWNNVDAYTNGKYKFSLWMNKLLTRTHYLYSTNKYYFLPDKAVKFVYFYRAKILFYLKS